MGRVEAAELPDFSRLHGLRVARDFMDCYRVRAEVAPRAAAEIIAAFPSWAEALVGVRRVVTTPFGLIQDGPEAEDKLGPFPVVAEDAREVLLGFDDRHLDFRVSVFCQGDFVHLATWVKTHNLGGRVYLAAIMPFHVLIARNALARVAAAVR